MKCSKCQSEVNKDSKFCGNCGKKIEEDLGDRFDHISREMSNVWFMVGFVKGVTLDNKEIAKKIDIKIEERLKESDLAWELYQNALKFCREHLEIEDAI